MRVYSVSLIILLCCLLCTSSPISDGGCSPERAGKRVEWGSLNPAQRIEYINAVLCMIDKPTSLPAHEYPGARNRRDDFIATHMNYTHHIHMSGIFLPWHRHFLWLWEKAVKEECGYSGFQPYWNWPLWASNLSSSPLFDGSETSVCGDGVFDPSFPDAWYGDERLPRGTGGGCAMSGPFKNVTLNFGPFDPNPMEYDRLPPRAFDYKPHCLTRNLNANLSARFHNQDRVDRLLASTDIIEFQERMETFPRTNLSIGLHGGGHNSVGGTMVDLLASPQDPSFMMHHSMVDRVWASWQASDEKNRRYALNGTSSIRMGNDTPPVTPDTILEFGPLDRPRKIRELLDPMENDYCYTYDHMALQPGLKHKPVQNQQILSSLPGASPIYGTYSAIAEFSKFFIKAFTGSTIARR